MEQPDKPAPSPPPPTGVLFIEEPGTLRVVEGALVFHPEAPPPPAPPQPPWQLLGIDTVVASLRVTITGPAFDLASKIGVNIAYVGFNGRCVGRFDAAGTAGLGLRIQQVRAFSAPRARMAFACSFIREKLLAQANLLEDYRGRLPDVVPRDAIVHLREQARLAAGVESLDALRGVEGAATRRYFEALRALLPEGWPFPRRAIRPPPDPVNSLLSFSYSLLATWTAGVLAALGFEVGLGFLHEQRPGRPALALDVMEPLRHQRVDRFVFMLIRKRLFHPCDFVCTEESGCLLRNDARKKFFHRWYELCHGNASASLVAQVIRSAADLKRRLLDHPPCQDHDTSS